MTAEAPMHVEESAEERVGVPKAAKKISIKKRFVADGVFLAELNQLFMRAIGTLGYTGLEVRVSSVTTEIRVRVTNHKDLMLQNKSKINELQSLIQKRFNYDKTENKVEVVAKPFENRGLSAAYQAESIRQKIIAGFPVRVVAHSALRFIMARNDAKGAEVSISGKLRGQRAKTQKYRAGYRVSTGQPSIDYISHAVRHCLLRQGVIGVQVKIMLPHDPTGQYGPKKPLPDEVVIHPPKVDA